MKSKFYMLVVFAVVSFCVPAGYSKNYKGKRVLYVNSYHPGYEWSDGEQEAAIEVLTKAGVETKVIYMDTKNNPSEDYKKKAGFEVRKAITGFNPDVLIVADDTAFKYVVMDYYRDAELPVVFCGINWDISEYGAPYKNTTGMLEVGHIEIVYKHIKQYVSGDRIGFLGYDEYSERKNAQYYATFVDGGFDHVEFVTDFETWKKKYLELQEKVDLIIFPGPTGIKNWVNEEAWEFAFNNIKIPMGTESSEMMPFCLIGAGKDAREQGEYAGAVTLRILDGADPADIPMVINKRGQMMINLQVADKLGVVFTPNILRSTVEIYGIRDDYD